MNPICSQDLHKDRKAEIGKCSGDLMICKNYSPRSKDSRFRDIYRCEKHAFHIMSFDHMKHIKFAYIDTNQERKKRKQGEEKMKCYWKKDILCLEPESKKDKDGLIKFKKLFEDANKTITTETLGFLLDFADEGARAFEDEGIETGEPTVEVVQGSKRIKAKRGRPRKVKAEDKSKKKRGRPKGSKNKSTEEIDKPKRKRGRPRKDGR